MALAEERIERIKLEAVATDKSSWEGEYLAFPGIDEAYQLFLSRKHGFVFRRIGNSGYSNAVIGSVSELSDEITLTPMSEFSLPACLTSTVVVARDSKTIFVVPKGRLHGFCLDFKSSTNGTVKGYFCKLDSVRSRKNELELPGKYKAYVSLHEIFGEILESRMHEKDISRSQAQLTISVGRKNHVFEGMRFILSWNDVDLGDQEVECEVSEVDDDRSFAVLVATRTLSKPVMLGTKVRTSKFPWPE